MVNCVQDIFFELDILHLFVLNDDVFADAFHGIKLAWLCAQFNQINFTKSTLTDHLLYFKVFQLCREFASIE